MAKFVFSVTGEGTKSIVLPVETTQVGKVLLTGLETVSVPFTITNSLAREVSFTSVAVLIEGVAAAKVGAVVRFDNITIASGASFENFLDIESSEELTEEDNFSILVSAEEVVA